MNLTDWSLKTGQPNFTALPTAFEGSCYSHNSYTITDVSQLIHGDRKDLPCILDAGVAPDAIPRGPAYGKPIAIASGSMFNGLTEAIWKGKNFTEMYCDGDQTVAKVMFNYLFTGGMFFPAQVAIGPSPVTDADLVENEPPIGLNDYLLIDYRNDMEDYCPQNPDPQLGPIWDTVYLKQYNNRLPFRNVLDVTRVVGLTDMGNPILLGRTLLKQTFADKYYTIAWFLITTQDSAVTSSITPHLSISTATDYEYIMPGLFTAVVDTLLSRTVPTKSNIKNAMLKLAKVYDEDNIPESIMSTFFPALVSRYVNYVKGQPFRPTNIDLHGMINEVLALK